MRSVSHCGQTISLYTLHPTRCQRSYTNSTKREITSQRFILSPFFSFSPIPSDEIPMERPEFNRVLRLILTSFSSAPEHNRDLPGSATVSFPLNIPKSPAIPDPLHGWNDHPRNRSGEGQALQRAG